MYPTSTNQDFKIWDSNQTTQEQTRTKVNTKSKPRKRRLESATLNGIRPEDMIRKFRTNYSFISWDTLKVDLDHYFKITLEGYAGNDTYEYKLLNNTDFATPEQRAMYFYKVMKLSMYKVDFPNPTYFKIIMKVDPCRGKGLNNDLCCDDSNEAVCEDNTSIVSGTDIGVAWLMTGYVMQCSELYKDTGTCGTYIEIHKPNNETKEDEL